MVLSGWVGGLVYLLLAAALGYSAHACYHLKPIGWRLAAGILGLMMFSSFITFLNADVLEIYRQMGMSPQEIEAATQLSAGSPRRFALLGSLAALPYLAYLLYVRRYFHKGPPAPNRTPLPESL